jgi:hypothetical protein
MNRRSHTRLFCICAAALFALPGCGTSRVPHSGLAVGVDAACGGAVWREQHALSAGVTISRKDLPDLHGTMLYEVRGNRLLIQFPAQGGGLASCGFDGHTLWIKGPIDSDYAEWPVILQWVAWVAVPYRLTGPSLRVREVRPITVAGATYRVAELDLPAYGRGICALFVEQGALRPSGVVPLRPGGIAPDAMPSDYAFAYEAFDVCDDVLVPTRWAVWPWDARGGVSAGGPIASISLRKLRFVYPDPDIFDAPGGEATNPAAHDEGRAGPAHLEEVSGGTP